jgi:hypothetical protein
MASIPLTLAELAKAQAEAEGFQNGPQPTLNQANLYTQDCLLNNPQTPGTPQSTTPYYPSSETPNLQLSTDDMPVTIANNFVILDALLVGFTPGSSLGVPIVQASAQVINTVVPTTLSITAAKTTLYTVSIYMKALGTGGAGTTYTKTLTYTAADGSGVQTITLILPLNTPNVVMETYPVLALAGTPVSTTGVFSGVPSPYTLSERIVEMP